VRRSLTRTCIAVGAVAALATACATSGQDTQQTASSESEFRESPEARQGSGSGMPMESEKVAELQTVYFDFDEAQIRRDERSTLRANAEAIGEADWDRIVLEGHCDERGSQEYNLALGERRADAVKRYLMGLGIPEDRIQTVSFGESRPAVTGSGEAAWQRNRRVEFGVR